MVAMARGFAGESITSFDDEMSEILLLLPRAQAAEVERTAHSLGLTTAQFIRRMLAVALCASESSECRPGRPR
jgi:hypothetical protein